MGQVWVVPGNVANASVRICQAPRSKLTRQGFSRLYGHQSWVDSVRNSRRKKGGYRAIGEPTVNLFCGNCLFPVPRMQHCRVTPPPRLTPILEPIQSDVLSKGTCLFSNMPIITEKPLPIRKPVKNSLTQTAPDISRVSENLAQFLPQSSGF